MQKTIIKLQVFVLYYFVYGKESALCCSSWDRGKCKQGNSIIIISNYVVWSGHY